MKQYLQLLQHVREQGVFKEDRTGTGTYAVFGYQMRFDLSQGFPLLTTKKLHLRSIIHELLWFLSGDTNIKYLQDNGVSIWDEWADANGDLPAHGLAWIEEVSGRVVKTELQVGRRPFPIRIVTTFKRDDALGIDVPTQMEEWYPDGAGEITGLATYGRFRRFEVQTEETVNPR